MELCFDKELHKILNAEEIIYVSLLLEDVDNISVDFLNSFIDSSAYQKLYEYYLDVMPYGVAKYRTGDADIWILSKLQERCLKNV